MVRSLGIIELSLYTPSSIPEIIVLMDIVPVNVLALLGLDVLDAEKLYFDNATNRLVHRKVITRSGDNFKYVDQWSVPISRHDNHLYSKMCFSTSSFYSTASLLKLDRQFAHPSDEKLYALLRHAGLKAVTQETLERLKEIVSRCEPCQRIRNAPLGSCASIGHENV